MTDLDLLQRYVDMGFSLIPITKGKKTPPISWQKYIHERANIDQIKNWIGKFGDTHWAVVTGKISGITVVDCDNPMALQAAHDLELTNGCEVKTPHGRHYYFKYNDDGKVRKTVSGHRGPGTYWPQIEGLDLRNNGGYALLPPSSGYEWQIEEETILDEMTLYKDWKGATFPNECNTLQQPQEKNFANLNLTNIALESSPKTKNLTREKYREIAEQYPTGKIQRGGSGIHDATFQFLSEEASFVGIGPELEEAGRKFMDDFFETPLIDGRFETSLATIRREERKNHPERFNEDGDYIYHLKKSGTPPPINLPIAQTKPKPPSRFLTTQQARQLADAHVECWQYPWLPKKSIVQVYGFSGQGKSLFLQHALHHVTTDLMFGCFEHIKGNVPKTLYLDFENGKATIGRRTDQMARSFGDPKDNLLYWTPWHNDEFISLRETEGLAQLYEMLNEVKPDILVIDTLRSAFPGLEENNAQAWSAINQLALRLRNAGCTVILVHHSNKPNKEGLGREAGSSNQLTTLETQLRVAQVYEDAAVAKEKGGIFGGDLEINPWWYMRNQLPKSAVLQMVFELSYGKVREWTDLHGNKQYIGIGQRQDGLSVITHSKSPKQRLKDAVIANHSREAIINKLGRPVKTLLEWSEEMGINFPNK